MAFDPYAAWLSIAPAEQPPSHYRLLGVPKTQCNPSAIDEAADRQVALVEPFLASPHAAEARTILRQISDARMCLLDAENRARYDAFLQTQEAASNPLPRQSSAPLPRVRVPVAAAQPIDDASVFASIEDPSQSSISVIRRKKRSGMQAAIRIAAGGSLGLLIAYVILARVFGINPLNLGGSPHPAATASIDVTNQGGPQQASPPPPITPSVERVEEPPDRQQNGEADRQRPMDQARANDADSSGPTKGGGTESSQQTTPRPPLGLRDDREPYSETGRPRPNLEFFEDADVSPPPIQIDKPQKLNPPDAAAQSEALKIVKEVHASEYAQASDKPQKQALARRLIELANRNNDDPVGRFVLLTEALDLASSAGDADLTLTAISLLDEWYVVDPWPMREKVFTTWSKMLMPRAQRFKLGRLIASIARQSVEAERYDIGLRLWSLAQETARKAGDTALAKDTLEPIKEVKSRITQVDKVQRALVTLEADPDNTKANVLAGHYYSVVRGDWKKGLPYLARSNNESLRKVAEQDLAGADDPGGQVKIGDAWWDFAQSVSQENRGALLARAAHWYAEAQTGLVGLQRLRVEKRLSEISKTAAKSLPDGTVPPDPYGFHYLAFAAHQVGSAVEIDNLVVKNLDTDETVYANNFDVGNVADLALLFKPTGNESWSVNSQKTRIKGGRLRLECDQYRRSGVGGDDSYATMVLLKRLPLNFSINFVVNKLRTGGHFYLQICQNEAMTRRALRVDLDGSSLRHVEVVALGTEEGAWRGQDVLTERVANLQGNDVQFALTKTGRTLQLSVNDTTVATVGNLVSIAWRN